MSRAREYYQRHRQDRLEWRWLFLPQCMICGWHEDDRMTSLRWLEVHEIERRSAAPTRWADRCNYLLLCNLCHMDRVPLMDHAEQLSIKWRRDPEHFDLDAWLRLRDPELRAPVRVTMEEIEEYL